MSFSENTSDSDCSHNFEVIEGTAQEQVQSTPIATTQATLTAANHIRSPPKASQPVSSGAVNRSANSSSNKEGLKLLMQIQQDKNELMESFRELIGVQLPHPPPREKNHVDLFFDSVSSSVKALSPKLVAEAKMRVSQLICELELRALKENSANGDNADIEMPMPTSQGIGHHNISHHTHYGTLT
ncbi:GH20362 [Drosophila grimshawi]|uniref:GH13311 n=1 Tax=Drosophila grimshawi TaxID=7222 RepID=B4JRC1_DROGR|nr:GH13311 [Drosophila grimshawi]EDV94311.1 GH20362 [Drosophila grimshawi]